MLSLDELRELVGAAADVGETLAEFLRNAGLGRARLCAEMRAVDDAQFPVPAEGGPA